MKRKAPNDDDARRFQDHNGDIGMYMTAKRVKVAEQLDLRFNENDFKCSSIFQNLVIWIDGYTRHTPIEKLQSLIFKHGGLAVNTEQSNTTHVVTENLPEIKQKQYKSSRTVKVVGPAWIVDCCSEKRLLPTGKYNYFKSSSCRTSPFSQIGKTSSSMLSTKCSVSASRIDPRSQYSDSQKSANQTQPKSKKSELKFRLPSSSSSNRTTVEKSQQKPAVFAKPSTPAQANPFQKSSGVSSTLTDPNFVKNFFKASRLHFLGSWKEHLESILPALREIPPKYDACNLSSRYVVHIDMDCYFVNVALIDRPQLRGKPVVVCHSKSAGSGEVSSASYEARKFGIKAGMFMKRALQLCPSLQVVPYEFKKYFTISTGIYRIFHTWSNKIKSQSCDEAYIQLPTTCDPVKVANAIRKEIEEKYSCTASAGVSSNILLARLATAKAKPNGCRILLPKNAKPTLSVLPIRKLPGVGWSVEHKLNEAGINTCGDLVQTGLMKLRAILGPKRAQTFFNYAQGIDNRYGFEEEPRKSIAVEIGWGVRFHHEHQVSKFFRDLSQELSERTVKCGIKGRMLTVKIKSKHPEAADKPSKYLGHGWCETFSKSVTLSQEINDGDSIYSNGWSLFKRMGITPDKVRSVGLQLSKLNISEVISRASKNGSQAITTFFSGGIKSQNISNGPTPTLLPPKEKSKIGDNLEMIRSNSKHSKAQQKISMGSPSLQPQIPDSSYNKLQKFVASLPHHSSTHQQVLLDQKILVEVEGKIMLRLPKLSSLDVNAIKDLPKDTREIILNGYKSLLKVKPSNNGEQSSDQVLIVHEMPPRGKNQATEIETSSKLDPQTQLPPPPGFDHDVWDQLPLDLKLDIIEQRESHKVVESVQEVRADPEASFKGEEKEPLLRADQPKLVSVEEYLNHDVPTTLFSDWEDFDDIRQPLTAAIDTMLKQNDPAAWSALEDTLTWFIESKLKRESPSKPIAICFLKPLFYYLNPMQWKSSKCSKSGLSTVYCRLLTLTNKTIADLPNLHGYTFNF